jgi:hypothetical protein
VKPILAKSCIQCHGRGRSKGGFQLDSRDTLLRGGDSGPAISPGKSQDSLLIALVAGVDPDNIMPKKGSRLTAEQIGLLRAWIDQGAPWDQDVTFARPAPVNLEPHQPNLAPSSANKTNAVDQILAPYFAREQWHPPKPVNDRVFVRRVYLDIIGLLPAGDPAALLGSGDTAQQRSGLVRTLLADDEQYAQHWLSFWNDMLRNDYRGTGYIDGGRQQISCWLYGALAGNLPYDDFVRQLINPQPDSEGFTKGISWRGVVNASQAPPMQAAQNVAQVLMGVNLKCASCHDSFINDWKLSDAYSLACVFNDSPMEMFQCDKPTGQTAQAAFLYPELGSIDPQAGKAQRLERLAQIMTSSRNGRLSRTIVNRLWGRFFGRGLVEPLDDLEQPAWNQDLLDWLAEDLVAHHYDLKRTIEVILTSEAYQLPAVNLSENAAKDYVFRGPGVRRMSAEQFRDALGELAGVWFEKPELPVPGKEIRDCLVPADPLTVALGRPNREQVVTSRSSSATTLQALELTNGRTLAELLKQGARRLLENSPPTAELVERLYERGLSRKPTATENELAAGLIGQPAKAEGVEDLLWAMAMLPEFQLIY